MWLDQISNPGPLTYEPGALPTALRGPAHLKQSQCGEFTATYDTRPFSSQCGFGLGYELSKSALQHVPKLRFAYKWAHSGFILLFQNLLRTLLICCLKEIHRFHEKTFSQTVNDK